MNVASCHCRQPLTYPHEYNRATAAVLGSNDYTDASGGLPKACVFAEYAAPIFARLRTQFGITSQT